MKRKLLLSLLGLTIACIGLELLLQGLSYLHWRNATRPGTSGDGATVLCVGDSFTYGIGASQPDAAYPARAQRFAAAAGVEIHFVNAGWPGQTSRDVLLKLENQLRNHRPYAVYMLGGVNDVGAKPARVTDAELAAEAAAAGADASFPLRFRLPRFFRLLKEWFAGGPAYSQRDAVTSVVGDWHVGTVAVTFAADGRLSLSLGGHPMWWYMKGERLMLLAPGYQEFDTGYAFVGDELTLAIPGLPERLVLKRGLPDEVSPLERARRALRAGETANAIDGFTALLDDPVDGRVARVGLVQAFVAAGRIDAAAPHVDALVASARARPQDVALADPALRALAAVGRMREALAMAADVYRAGAQPPIWELMADVSQDPASHRELHAAVADTLASAELPAGFRGQLLRARVHVRRAKDPDGALRDLIEAELVDPQPAFTSSRMSDVGADAIRLDAVLDDLAVADARRAEIRSMLVAPNGSGVVVTLAAHLRTMQGLARRYGAEFVVVGYPVHEATVEQAQRTAAQVGIPMVPVRAAFVERLQREAWEDLFVVDGHCNDRGYALIAELVAADAIARRPR